MTVLLVMPFVLWTPHFETDLEIIQRHLDAGDRVIIMTCSAELLVCDTNPIHWFSNCMVCIGRRKMGLGRLTGTYDQLPLIHLTDADRLELRQFKIDSFLFSDVKAIRVGNLDLGAAVLSSLVSLTRDPDMDLAAPLMRKLVYQFMVASLAIYRSMQNYLREMAVDKVYVFNARFATTRPVLRACEEAAIPCATHDRGCDLDHYSVYENVLPHDIASNERVIREGWAAADPGTRESVAAKFYEQRSRGVIQNWYSFVLAQQAGMLPAGWNEDLRNIVIFTSSEDEFVAVGDEWRNPLYATQLEGLRRIATDTCNLKGVRLYIRIHPNLTNIVNASVAALRLLRSPNLEVIPPEAAVSSYALMWNCDRTLSFGSTAGIEAAYWGKPSILAGMSFYCNLGATYNPNSHEELLDLLTVESLPPKERTGALMFGYCEQTRGERFKHFEATGVHDGLYRGDRITPVRPYDSLARTGAKGRRGQWANKGVFTWSRMKLGM